MTSLWGIGIVAYLGLAVATALPLISSIFRTPKLHPGGPSFRDAAAISDEAKLRLQQNYDRMHGTLLFWKKQAEMYRAAHYYCLWWTAPSAVIIPFLAQASSGDELSKWMVTIVSAFTAILLTSHRAFKVAENFRAFREGESAFYDNYRRMLDRPGTFGATEVEQVEKYLDEVENLRRFVRNAELDNTPSIDQVKSQVSDEKGAGR